MAQKLYPSAHILEMFMPYLHDEKRLIEVLKVLIGKDFYRNVELPSFPTAEHRRTVRRILEDNGVTAITFVAPFLNERKMSLCDLDDRRRGEVLDYLKMHADYCAESGYMTFGVPSEISLLSALSGSSFITIRPSALSLLAACSAFVAVTLPFFSFPSGPMAL